MILYVYKLFFGACGIFMIFFGDLYHQRIPSSKSADICRIFT